MSDTISPPPGFSLVQPQAEPAPTPKPPPGFSLVGSEGADQPSTTMDVAHGVNRGLIQGASSLLGIPADLFHLIDKGSMYGLTKGAEKIGLMSPEAGEAIRSQHGIDEGLRSDAINGYLTKAANAAGINTSKPNTLPGQYAETISSFLPTAATMGEASVPGMARALTKYGAVPGAASEAAGQLTQGTPIEPYARAAGALAPALPSAAMAALERIANPMGKALQGASPAQLNDAQSLLEQSRAESAPLTVPEAIQKATGSGTRLGDVQRVVEQSPEGAAVMRPFMAQRPGQTQALGQKAFGAISPTPPNPYEVAPQVQDAAQGVVGAADKARTAAVNPLYTAAAKDEVHPDQVNALIDRTDQLIAADKTGILSPALARFRNSLIETPAQPATATAPAQPRVPITDIENLDRARKYFRDEMDLPPWAQSAVPKEVGSKVGSLLDDLRGMMETASPNFAAGKQKYQQITQDVMNPLLRSPTGQLAESETFPKQLQILFNPNPLPNSQMAVGKAVRDVASQNPEAAQQMVRMYLEKTFNEATQANLPGANQFGGPKFAAVVAGNSQQAANLEAAIRALPDGATRWNALRKSLDIMEGMGTRQAVGSQTEFNRQINEALKSGHPAGEMLATAASPANWTTLGKKIYQNFAYGRNTAQLARVFTQGDVSDLQKIVGSGSRSLRGQAALVGALAREGAVNQQSDQE